MASLELFATLVCVMAFSEVTGGTDNLGNSSALRKLMSSKFPLVVILGELGEQLMKAGVDMDLEWMPRDENELADALTNGVYGAFDPDRRIRLDVAALPFLVLKEYMSAAEELYARTLADKEAAARKRREAPEARQGRPHKLSRGKKVPLRQRDPW